MKSAIIAVALLLASLVAAAPASAAACATGTILASSVELTSAGTTVTFSSIPQTGSGGSCSWSNLILTGTARDDSTTVCDPSLAVTLNGDTTSNYNWEWLHHYGTGPGQVGGYHRTRIEAGQIACDSRTAGGASSFNLKFSNFTGSTYHKNVKTSITDGYNTTCCSGVGVMSFEGSGMWLSTSGITQIDLTPSSGSFKAGTTFNLYIE